VILGGGFGGAYCAQSLEKKLKNKEADIYLVDRNNFFIFYPLLVEAGTGELEPRHAVISMRQFLKDTTFRMGEVTATDFDEKKIEFNLSGSTHTEFLHYDQLVLSLGSVTNLPDIPGLKEHAFQMKRLTDAIALRDRAIQLLEIADSTEKEQERKSLLHFVVVGGNFSGVEVAGQFDEFLKQASRSYKNVKTSDCKITLIEIMDKILNVVKGELSDFAVESLMKRGINILLKTTVTEIESDYVKLNNGEKLPTRTVVWCAGIAPNPLIEKISVPLDNRGYILCEDDLRVKDYKDVWAIGDCAVNIDQKGNPYPATAQHAVGQAKIAAKNIVNVLNNKETQPCILSSKGTLAALGCRTAVAKVFGIKFSGFPAWFLWRTVYLFKMPGLARRIRIALDWAMDLLFKRDYVQLGARNIQQESR
jgi:NADH dehydrogenase